MKDFMDYVVKNKYVIICVAIVVILYACGIVEFLTKAVILVVLLAGAIFVGKFLQDHEGDMKDFFKNRPFRKQETYYYEENVKPKK